MALFCLNVPLSWDSILKEDNMVKQKGLLVSLKCQQIKSHHHKDKVFPPLSQAGLGGPHLYMLSFLGYVWGLDLRHTLYRTPDDPLPPKCDVPEYIRVWESDFSRASLHLSSSCRVLTRSSATNSFVSTWSSLLFLSVNSFSSCCCCSFNVTLLASNFSSSLSCSFWSL